MKNSIPIIILLLLQLSSFGQSKQSSNEYDIELKESPKGKKVSIELIDCSVSIIGEDINKITVTAFGRQSSNEDEDKNAQGLTKFAQGGLKVEESGNNIKLTNIPDRADKYIIKIPKRNSLSVRVTDGDVLMISDQEGEVEVNTVDGNLNLENVTGPIIANSTDGNVKILYSKVTQENPHHINVVDGNIDISMPSNSKANFKISTLDGQLYSDFDFANNKFTHQNNQSFDLINGSLNGGGVDFHIKTIDGNIYLRKK